MEKKEILKQTSSTAITVLGQQIKDVKDPIDLQDVATKKYVDTSDASLSDRIDALAGGGSDISITQSLYDILFPIGEIKIASGVSLPKGIIATWTDLGELADGQSLIGGTTSNGSVISHNHALTMNSHNHSLTMNSHSHTQAGHRHTWLKNDNQSGSDYLSDHSGAQSGYTIVSMADRNNNFSYGMLIPSGNPEPDSGRTNSVAPTINSATSTGKIGSTTTTGTVESNGGTTNNAYGLGVGAGIHIWKRIA